MNMSTTRIVYCKDCHTFFGYDIMANQNPMKPTLTVEEHCTTMFKNNPDNFTVINDKDNETLKDFILKATRHN